MGEARPRLKSKNRLEATNGYPKTRLNLDSYDLNRLKAENVGPYSVII